MFAFQNLSFVVISYFNYIIYLIECVKFNIIFRSLIWVEKIDVILIIYCYINIKSGVPVLFSLFYTNIIIIIVHAMVFTNYYTIKFYINKTFIEKILNFGTKSSALLGIMKNTSEKNFF